MSAFSSYRQVFVVGNHPPTRYMSVEDWAAAFRSKESIRPSSCLSSCLSSCQFQLFVSALASRTIPRKALLRVALRVPLHKLASETADASTHDTGNISYQNTMYRTPLPPNFMRTTNPISSRRWLTAVLDARSTCSDFSLHCCTPCSCAACLSSTRYLPKSGCSSVELSEPSRARVDS
jgi:hypothetical protein